MCESVDGTFKNDPCPCFNKNALASLAGCYYNNNKLSDHYISEFLNFCAIDYNQTITLNDIDEAIINYVKNAKYPHDIENFDIDTTIDLPIKLDQEESILYVNSITSFLENFDDSMVSGSIMLGYWVIVIIMGSIASWTKILFPGLLKDLNGKVSIFVRKYITLPAAIRRKKTNDQQFLIVFQMLIPSRFESIVITTFLILVGILCSIEVTPIENDPIFATRTIGVLRYVAGRSGVSVGLLVPLLILFGGRNNFLLWLTKWNYATFITYHRWIGRVVFLLSAIHAITFSLSMNSLGTENYATMMKQKHMIWGTVSMIAVGIIVIQGFLFIRRRNYELFQLMHIVLGSLFIAGAWIHVYPFNHAQFYIVATLIWVIDRLTRIARLFVFGFPKAKLELIADETIKITIPMGKLWKPVAGGFAYIHFMKLSCFWQSHPFTYNESVEDDSKIVFYVKVKGGMTHGLYKQLTKLPNKSMFMRVSVEGPYGDGSPCKRYDNAVYVGGGNGIPGMFYEAKHIASKANDSNKQNITLVWVIREYKSLFWFYEELKSLQYTKINTIVYVTRPSSGFLDKDEYYRRPINQLVPENLETMLKCEETIVYERELTSELSTITTMNESELDFGSSQESLPISDVYDEVTLVLDSYLPPKYPSAYDSQKSQDPILKLLKSDFSHVNFVEGRPSMNELIETTVKETCGSIGVVTCGHPVMVDDLRKAVIDNLDNKEGKRIDFFEHLQVWA